MNHGDYLETNISADDCKNERPCILYFVCSVLQSLAFAQETPFQTKCCYLKAASNTKILNQPDPGVLQQGCLTGELILAFSVALS